MHVIFLPPIALLQRISACRKYTAEFMHTVHVYMQIVAEINHIKLFQFFCFCVFLVCVCVCIVFVCLFVRFLGFFLFCSFWGGLGEGVVVVVICGGVVVGGGGGIVVVVVVVVVAHV